MRNTRKCCRFANRNRSYTEGSILGAAEFSFSLPFRVVGVFRGSVQRQFPGLNYCFCLFAALHRPPPLVPIPFKFTAPAIYILAVGRVTPCAPSWRTKTHPLANNTQPSLSRGWRVSRFNSTAVSRFKLLLSLFHCPLPTANFIRLPHFPISAFKLKAGS